nr:glycine cleavage system protein GcvH [Microbacterium bovistercoris]
MTDLNSLRYTAEHEWIARSGEVATVGITDYAADKLGDVVYVDLPDVGTAVTAGDVCGEIESTKSVGELYAPVTGTVVEVNSALDDDPSAVNSDPFGDGWLIRIEGEEAADTLDRDGYLALIGGEQ